MSDRHAQIVRFLADTEWSPAALTPITGDASARRYFRLHHQNQSAILMDAPPHANPNIEPFLRIADWLRENGLSAPQILHSDPSTGFILIEDLGDALFASLTAKTIEPEQTLYRAATDVLVELTTITSPPNLPQFTPTIMADQIDLLFDWYLTGLDTSEISAIQGELETALHLCSAPPTILLRDYHAENLIWLPDRKGTARVGLLDFQDAMIGPPGYDLVSLLWDARRDVTPDTVKAMIQYFAQATGRTIDDTQTAFAIIGLQRNLRILGIFARLCLRDGKPRYIDFIPRVFGYVQSSLHHPALARLNDLLGSRLPKPTPQHLDQLRQKCATAPTR